MKLRVNEFLPSTRVEGPGIRACIWVQGCSIQCPGCAVPRTWPETGGEEHTVEELASRIIEGPDVEGVTFMGGEPFEQAGALALLAGMLRGSGLSIVTFSGYEYAAIEGSTDPEWRQLFDRTDLLIAGPYLKEKADLSRPWIGSSNQTYHFLTSRYRHLEGRLEELPNGVEIRIHPNGRVFMNGMADVDELQELAAAVDPAAEARAVARDQNVESPTGTA